MPPPGPGGSLGAYALVGMGAVFAGAARAPITAVVILFELTGEYTIILPLMLAIVLATGISHLMSHDTVYTRKLLRRGIDIDEPADASLRRRPVSDVMTDPAGVSRRGLPLRNGRGPFAASAATVPCRSSTPTADYLGTLAAHDLMDALASGEDTTIGAPPFPPPPLDPAASIGDALKHLNEAATPFPSKTPTEPLSAGSATATCSLPSAGRRRPDPLRRPSAEHAAGRAGPGSGRRKPLGLDRRVRLSWSSVPPAGRVVDQEEEGEKVGCAPSPLAGFCPAR